MRASSCFPSALLLPLATSLACTGGDAADSGSGRSPGQDEVVSVFDAEYIHFGGEDANRRSVDVEVTFPHDASTYRQLTGRFRLHCPNDACDYWDRYGTFGIVLDPGTDDEHYVELDRFITAYRVGFSWESDLTALRPLLTGTQTMRVFIDTWVTEGHDQGDGWLFDAEVAFEGGDPPSPEPVAVVPAWGHLAWNAGLDDQPVETQVVPVDVTLPDDATAVTFRSFITGHGWNNSQNCAEFCAKDHYYTVGGQEFGREVWRDDCGDTDTDGVQQGTWQYDRAGWCPGAQVFPWDTDVSAEALGGGAVATSYRLQDFTWRGDGDQPFYYMSGVYLVSR